MEYKTDSLLVHLARAGDEDACEKLVKKYYSSIYQPELFMEQYLN